jgi:hypothetical protein
VVICSGEPGSQSVQCPATDWTTGRSSFDPRQRQRIFTSSFYVQTGLGAHPASSTMGTGGSFPCKLLPTISVAPVITGISKHFMFHIR